MNLNVLATDWGRFLREREIGTELIRRIHKQGSILLKFKLWSMMRSKNNATIVDN